MGRLTERMMEIPSYQYGAYQSSLDRFPDERRWAKRFALYKLRELIRSFSREYDIVYVEGLTVIEHAPLIDCGVCVSEMPYTWGWKCHFVLANK